MIISISPWGGIGNKIIELMVGMSIGESIKPYVDDTISYNCSLPEWQFIFDAQQHEELSNESENNLIINDIDLISITEIVEEFKFKRPKNIILNGYFQRFELFESRGLYIDKIFGKSEDFSGIFSKDDLVINIRAGELRDGRAWWYPLVPIKYYKDIVSLSKLNPVFIGQIEQSRYIDQLRVNFPDATYIESEGPVIDLARMRNAHNICPSVSTFSWVASWISNANSIYYPLLGFLHPRCFPVGMHGLGGINLTPYRDARYKYYLFPFIKGESEDSYLDYTLTLENVCKEIAIKDVEKLQEQKSNYREKKHATFFDEIWYLKEYQECAWEISQGLYDSALEHYLTVGVLRGYSPRKQMYYPSETNVSSAKFATQSSVSEWSIGKNIEEDAARALDGDNDKEIGFHTDLQYEPWWMVDLASIYFIECINIFNRKNIESIKRRLFPFAILISNDGKFWSEVSRHNYWTESSHSNVKNMPIQAIYGLSHQARFIKIVALGRRDFLHLCSVEIYGKKIMNIIIQDNEIGKVV